MNIQLPYLISLPKIGDESIGFLSVIEKSNLPVEIKRVYWAHGIPNGVVRGHHAHKKLEQILICLHGKILVETLQRNGEKQSFVLDNPTLGLFLPPSSWHKMEYREDAVELVLASDIYSEDDYIRDFDEFMKGS